MFPFCRLGTQEILWFGGGGTVSHSTALGQVLRFLPPPPPPPHLTFPTPPALIDWKQDMDSWGPEKSLRGLGTRM